jgi:hypothetical protein
MPTEAMAEKLAKGRSARFDYELAERRRARRVEDGREVSAWVQARFPLEKRAQAHVAALMLRSVHGKGRVTGAMVKRRMEAHDNRFGLEDERSERGCSA